MLDRHLPEGAQISDDVCSLLYEDVRCGMYHSMMTGQRIVLSRETNGAVIAIDEAGVAVIHPDLLCDVISDHFSHYVMALFDPANTALRDNFRARFTAKV